MPLILRPRAAISAVLEPGAVPALPPPQDGVPRYPLIVDADGRRFSVDLSAKSVRRAIVAAREHGEACVIVLQGKLVGDSISEAGIAAQLKAPKPVAEATVESAPAEPPPA